MASPLNDPKLKRLLDRLHTQSDVQVEAINAHLAQRAKEGTLGQGRPFDDELHRFLSDKMVALDREKAQFCDPMPRALMARFGRTAAVHVVEQVEELRPAVRGRAGLPEVRARPGRRAGPCGSRPRAR